MKHAWIENNRVRDAVTEDPFTLFHADIAQHYTTQVADEVLPGAELVEGEWVNPAPPAPQVPATQPIPIIGPIAFQMLFSVEELVAIEVTKETDHVVKIFFKLLEDPRTDIVDRNLKTVRDGLQYLEVKGLIGPGRAQEIITGEVAK